MQVKLCVNVWETRDVYGGLVIMETQWEILVKRGWKMWVKRDAK